MRSLISMMMCGTAVCLNGAFAPAFAAESSEADAARESAQAEIEIIVSARRIEENIQDVPQTITAIRGDELVKLNLFNFLRGCLIFPQCLQH